MPALTGAGFGVLKPPKLPTLTSLTKTVIPNYGPSPTQAQSDAYKPPAGQVQSQVGGGGYSTTPAPAAAPVSESGSQPASPDPTPNPQYAWDINNDPLYSQFTNFTLPSLLSQAQGNQQEQTRQAIEQFGEVPDLTNAISGLGLDPNSSLYSMIFGDIDPATQSAAQALTQSGLSTTAGLDKQHATDIQSLLDTMASRGTVQSGGTGVGLGQADQTYNQNEYNARTSLLQYLTGVQSAFNQAQQSAYQQQQQAATDAAQRQISLVPGIGTVAAPGGTV